jgi:alpha-glucosidase (family GH31 glycosyl hydrolase)
LIRKWPEGPIDFVHLSMHPYFQQVTQEQYHEAQEMGISNKNKNSQIFKVHKFFKSDSLQSYRSCGVNIC